MHVNACSLLVGLLSMCEVMRLHMNIELVGLDGDYELGLVMSNYMKFKYAFIDYCLL